MKRIRIRHVIKLLCMVSLVSPSLSYANEQTQEKILAENFIPDGYSLQYIVNGDLNDDGLEDALLLVKKVDKENHVINNHGDAVDRNRRGIIILLKKQDSSYRVSVQNMDAFSSDFEDGGMYYAPELLIDIKENKLYIHYKHGRYGNWMYTFKNKADDFELIGYNQNEHFGPIISTEISINFLTQKRLVRDNINKYKENADELDPVFTDTWEDLPNNKTIKLSQITDFDSLSSLLPLPGL